MDKIRTITYRCSKICDAHNVGREGLDVVAVAEGIGHLISDTSNSGRISPHLALTFLERSETTFELESFRLRDVNFVVEHLL